MRRCLLICALLLAIPCFGFGQTFTQSSLPIVIINTNGAEIPDEPKISADMGIIDNLSGINSITDEWNGYAGKIGIEIRGSSSQMFPKKQYGIELRDVNGNDLKTPLLGLPPEEDWILFAPYNDKSLIRDALAYNLGRKMGHYASRSRFCELVLNGQYEGVYLLLEKIKRGGQRVDISDLNPDENSGDDVTGGYILKIDKTTGNSNAGWSSAFSPKHRDGAQYISFLCEYPSAEDITSAQRTYIQQFMSQLETTLNGSKYNDRVNGYAKYIDVDSFIDYLIMNELTRNVDGYRISTFFHKQKDSKGGKLVMGPIWDFNLGFGNANYCEGHSKTGYAYEFNEVCPWDWWLVPFWWERLMLDISFKRRLSWRWFELRETVFSDTEIVATIDSLTQVIGSDAITRNFQRWDVIGTYVWPNFYVGDSYDAEVDWLKKWIDDRMSWLDNDLRQYVTDVENDRPDMKVIVAPNPLRGALKLRFETLRPFTADVMIIDAVGKVISRQKLMVESGSSDIQLSELNSPGIYHLKVTVNGLTIHTDKLMVQ